MKIQHNLLAMNANRNIKINTGKSAKTTEKLSSGYRINRAADDAAGLSISEKMRRLIRGLTQASQNCQDGISMVQTAEGALHEVHDMLQRMNELAVQSANGTNTAEDREALQKEFEHIQEEIDRVSQTTTFNAMRLFADEDSSAGTTNAGGASGANNTNGTGGTNGTSNSNTPSVTSADETGQQAPVMRTMSLRSVARAAETSITVGDFTLTGTDLVEGTDYSYSNNTLTILSDKAVTISGTTTTGQITIDNGIEANVTLSGVSVDLSSGWFVSPVSVGDSAKLNLTLTGENILKGGSERAGLLVADSATLVIDGAGAVSATGNKAAGIGGHNRGTGGTIIINGGTVITKGGENSAGIGSGVNASSTGNITINGGNVTAEGSVGGAGIGGGNNIGGGNVTINGGTVTAIGGEYGGAGIGGGAGPNGNGGKITITGGIVTAKGRSGGAAIGAGSNGVGAKFTTGQNGNAIITTEGGITDQSDKANWSGWINEQTYGNPILSGNGTIDLSTITGKIIITDTGYKIGNTEYAYTGPYTFSGSTTEEILVEDDADITFNNVTGTKLTVKDNSTVNVALNGTSEINEVIVESGSTLNTSGNGTLKVKTKLDNDGTVNIGSGSTIENDGTIENSNIINNNGTLDNDGTLKNDGTVNNNTGSTIDNTNGTIDNSNGTINDNGTITGNQPTTGGGSGGTGGGTGGGSGTGGATVGEAKNSWWIQAGSEAGQGINIQIGAMNTKVLGIEKGTVNILTQESSGNAITAVSGAIEKLSEQRSRLGAYQNRLEHTIYNLDNVVENTTAAESQIRDADMAELMVEHSSNNIIMQAAQAMLAQANHQPDGVLQLLQ